jgi:hypothetical protein
MLNYNTSNIFKVLANDQEDVYDGFEEVIPYNIVGDGKWIRLTQSPVGKLINERFSSWYTGKLMLREINAIKAKLYEAKNNLDTYRDDNKCELIASLREQKKLCKSSDKCVQKLNDHLKICGGIDGKYKCEKYHVSYDCQFTKENGRCSHYYEIKHIEEQLEDYQYVIDEYYSSYLELEISYERALAVKENRLEEYIQQIEDDYENWNFDMGQRMGW